MEIADWRKKIDELDEQIVRLYQRASGRGRGHWGAEGARRAAPIYEPQREQSVFEHVQQVNPGPLSDAQSAGRVRADHGCDAGAAEAVSMSRHEFWVEKQIPIEE